MHSICQYKRLYVPGMSVIGEKIKTTRTIKVLIFHFKLLFCSQPKYILSFPFLGLSSHGTHLFNSYDKYLPYYVLYALRCTLCVYRMTATLSHYEFLSTQLRVQLCVLYMHMSESLLK